MIAFFIWTGVNTQHSAGFVVHVTRLALAFLGIIKPLLKKKKIIYKLIIIIETRIWTLDVIKISKNTNPLSYKVLNS